MGKVKEHLKKHKVIYLSAAGACVGVLVGVGVGYYLGRTVDIDTQAKARAQVVGLINFKSPAIAAAVVVPQGHPGFVIQCKETGEVFMSQNQAAKNMGIAPSVLSGHLNGKFDNAGGHTFVRLGVAQVDSSQ